MLLDEASYLLQPCAFLFFAVDLISGHELEDVFDFRFKGEAGRLTCHLLAAGHQMFGLSAPSSEN